MRRLGTTTRDALLAIPIIGLVSLNLFGGLMAGVWLVWIGQSARVGAGILLTVLMPAAWLVASIPVTGLTALALREPEKAGRLRIAVFASIAALWHAGLIAAWTFYAFSVLTTDPRDCPRVPLLVWAYSTVRAPLSYMASWDDADHSGTNMAILQAFLSCVLLIILWILDTSRTAMILSVTATAVVIGAVQALLAFMAQSSGAGDHPIRDFTQPTRATADGEP